MFPGSKMQEVLDSIEYASDGDRHKVALSANRMLNCVGGRPSDAARSEVASYQRLGPEKYREQYERVRADDARRW